MYPKICMLLKQPSKVITTLQPTQIDCVDEYNMMQYGRQVYIGHYYCDLPQILFPPLAASLKPSVILFSCQALEDKYFNIKCSAILLASAFCDIYMSTGIIRLLKPSSPQPNCSSKLYPLRPGQPASPLGLEILLLLPSLDSRVDRLDLDGAESEEGALMATNFPLAAGAGICPLGLCAPGVATLGIFALGVVALEVIAVGVVALEVMVLGVFPLVSTLVCERKSNSSTVIDSDALT
ncbi:hypothetical protein F5141DRAFT_1066104 [Pisolithus sp. B1]|nr:hypothetical protein F5141DRAFT_1066104 [Pisolithus sp. B1]